MMRQLAAAAKAALRRLKPTKPIVVAAVELAGLAAAVYGVHHWTAGGAYVVAGVGLIVEAYALERR